MVYCNILSYTVIDCDAIYCGVPAAVGAPEWAGCGDQGK